MPTSALASQVCVSYIWTNTDSSDVLRFEAHKRREEVKEGFHVSCWTAEHPGVKDRRLITLIVAYFHGNCATSGNLASLANDTERVIILAPG